MQFDDIRQQATIDLARFIPPRHFLLRGHTPQAYSEIVEPLLKNPRGLTRRELAAAKAIASWVTFEEVNREIFGTLATDFGDNHKEMSTEEDLKTAALEHIARNAAHLYAKHVGDRLLVEAWPLSVWMPVTKVTTAMQVAPAQVPASETPLDDSLLGTRRQLIAAFGSFTGMDDSWFDNVKDTPALRKARKVVGLGGRKSTEPLFCPYEVLVWLIDKRRKKGNPMSKETGWRMLKHHFPAAYTPRSSYDPNNSD